VSDILLRIERVYNNVHIDLCMYLQE